MKDFPRHKSKYIPSNQLSQNTPHPESADLPKTNENLNNVAEARRRGLFLTRRGKALARLLAMDPDDQFAHHQINELLKADKERESLTAPFLKRPENQGHIVLGVDPFDGTPHLQSMDEITNSISVGVPGSGKSTHISLLAPQIANCGIKTLLVDSEKEELRNLVNVFEKYGLSLQVCNGRTFPFNPLEIPNGVEPREFLEHMAFTVGAALDLAEPGIRLLKEVIYQQNRANGIYDGGENFPVLFDIRALVAQHRTSNALTREALLARLDSVLINNPGFRFRKGERTEKLAANNIIIECSGMGPEARDLLIGAIATKEFLRRKKEGYVNAPIDWIFVIDDAQKICANPDGHLARSINVIRSTGIAFHLFVQSARSVTPQILDNSQTQFFGLLSSADEIQHAARSLGILTHEQTRWMASDLKRGQWICKLGHGWRKPILLQVQPNMVSDYLPVPQQRPYFKRISHVSSSQDSENRSVFGTTLEKAEEYLNWVPPEWNRPSKKNEKREKAPTGPLTERQLEMLNAVIQSPGRPCSTYNDGRSFTQRIAIKIRNGLVEKGLLREEIVKTKKLGRTAKIIYPTEAGKKLLARINKESGKTP